MHRFRNGVSAVSRVLAGVIVVFTMFLGEASAQFGSTVSKSCTNCRKEVSISSHAGQTCPHCGVVWSLETTTTVPGMPGWSGGTGESSTTPAQRARDAYVAKARKVLALTDQSELARIAIADADAQVRRLAAGQLTEKTLLRKVYDESTDEEVLVLVVWRLNGAVAVADDAPAAVRTAVNNSKTAKTRLLDLGNDVSLEMVVIPPGTFMRGDPPHEVRLTQGFMIGRYEVTQRQYREIMGENPSHFKGDDLPVDSVNWHDAGKFCDALTKRERAAGRLSQNAEYRLPTEAEWEYACRAGITTDFNNGLDSKDVDGQCAGLEPVGWYIANSDGKTHPVGRKRPNDWGLYDMHGNVWEWCLDWYETYPGTATDPKGASSGSTRAERGGSWNDRARYCQTGYRSHDDPSYSYDSLGFRTLLPLGQQ